MTGPSFPTLDATIEGLSKDVWERLRDVTAFPPTRFVRFGEGTITDILMLDLNRRNFTMALFTQTPKPLEAISGTDFEWWLGSDATGWLRFAVQSKKLDLRSQRYANLKHDVNGVLQLDCLEQYAASNQATPLYCLYNYSDHVDPMKHWHCCQRCFQAEELGCTITPSANIRNSLQNRGMRDFDSVHTYPETVPWRCLASCPRIGEILGLAQVHQTQGLARGSSPLFLESPRRIYPELPGRLRSERQSDGPRRSREPIAIDELDLDFYDKDAGPPKRICLLETTPRDPASP